MRNNMKRRSICFLVTLLLIITAPAAPWGPALAFRADGRQSLSSIAGNWTLTKVGDTDGGRTIRLVVERAQLKGSYITRQGEEKPIGSASFRRGRLSFKVPDLQLYFDMRLVGNRLEGKMTTYSLTEKRAPESVIMTRQR